MKIIEHRWKCWIPWQLRYFGIHRTFVWFVGLPEGLLSFFAGFDVIKHGREILELSVHFHIKSMLKSFTGKCSMYSYRFDCRGQVHNDLHFEHLEIQVESLRSASQKSSPQLNMVCLETGTPLSTGLIIIFNLMLVMYYYIIWYYIILYYIILY
jgi:hypothetical protein